MPTYSYKCKQCNDILDVTHRITDTPTIICGGCGYDRVKVFTSPAAHFPGSGWGSDR